MTAAKVHVQPTVRLDITLFSADDCEGRYSIAAFDTQRQATAIQWLPSEPTLQTESVRFDLSGTRFVESTEEIDGDTWRSLESFGLIDLFTDRLMDGEPAEGAAAELLEGL